MIADKETNFVYVSGLLESGCSGVFKDLRYWFKKLNINCRTLTGTNDLWVVDFMPLQVSRYQFVQFQYAPDYLKPKLYRHTKTNSDDCTAIININILKSTVVLDGGNIVKHNTKAILTNKIFKENPGWTEDDLLTEIKSKLGLEQLIIIPQEPGDFVGHADGMVRFIDEDTVLINEYPDNRKYQNFALNLRSALRNAGLKCVPFTYTAWRNQDANDATGCYINFLEIDKFIFMPTFGAIADEPAAMQLKDAFIDREIITIDCSELAKSGGVLNCATWNILQTRQVTPALGTEKIMLNIGECGDKIILKKVMITDTFFYKIHFEKITKAGSDLFITIEDAWKYLKNLFPLWHELPLTSISPEMTRLCKDDYLASLVQSDEIKEQWLIHLLGFEIGF